MHCIHGIQDVQTPRSFLFLNFASECRLLPLASSRVTSLDRTHVLCCCSKWRVGVAEGKAGGGEAGGVKGY